MSREGHRPSAGAARAPGRVTRVNGPLVELEGLGAIAMLDVVEVGPNRLPAEAVSVSSSGRVAVQAYEYTGGLCVDDGASPLGHPLAARLGPHLLGGIFDGLLRPLGGADAWLTPGMLRPAAGSVSRWHFTPRGTEGATVGPGSVVGVVAGGGGFEHRVLVPPGLSGEISWMAPEGDVEGADDVAIVGDARITVSEWWPIRVARPVRARLGPAVPLLTGQRVVDLLFPVAKGSTVAVPGGFGTGKTVLLQQIVRWCDADVIIFVGCGERGNELADALTDLGELSDPKTGRKLLERTVVIANTSNMPVMAREASIYTGMTVAEYYRDMGYDTVLLADSTSRWAEAL
ncbi:MAG TPA: hypothetical protein VEH29_14810, partial [Acidimicrobiales bacterium]|nr:hypothetical protein [Acidimicrobiales bacterium]